MSDRPFERAIHDWLEDGSDRTPPAAVDAVLFAVKTTPQERGFRIPRRFTLMPTYLRYAAAVAIVAIAGVGVVAVNSIPPGAGGGSPGPSVAATPTVAPVSEAPSAPVPSIPVLRLYTSAVHGFTMGYPADWSVGAPATREWQAGDVFPADSMPYADAFVSPDEGDASVALFVWEMPAGDGADLDSFLGLKTWADAFCADVVASGCEGFTQNAVAMCLDAGGDACRPAILVPTASWQYAFFMDWTSAMFVNAPDLVRVAIVPREDDDPSTARYGGSVALLKAVLTTMDVWAPDQHPAG